MADYLIVTHRVANPIGLATLETLASSALDCESLCVN